MKNEITREIRKPAVAGSFYPREEENLKKTLEELLSVDVSPVHDARGLVVPHAGYMFSGSVAGTAYASVSKMSPEIVVMIGPSHREYFDGICIYNGKAYETPLGEVEVEASLREKLIQAGEPIWAGLEGHRSNGDGEHCLEVQLPFLQTIFDDFKILPIIMGDQRWDYCELLGDLLAQALQGSNALIIASSDLSHYHSYEVAQSIDAQFILLLEKSNPRELAIALERKEVEACGGGPVVATLIASKKLGAPRVQTLLYRNSGDVWVDKTRVVGYLAALFVP
ncbi:MAG: AmmeMemoRadiSam system protein B [Calditrichaeota bacterium]|nr:MAG: AmmeMemoRadiSam system protein B [Calditrichota bacterium]